MIVTMKAKKIFLSIFPMLFSLGVFSQNLTPSTLMTIGGDLVTVEDFMNVYKKNNNKGGAGLDRKSMEEYLELYSIFRLKVKEAKEMGIDTTKTFKDELSGYRKTLAQPYLTDKETVDNLVKEAYDRLKWDIRTSHILIEMKVDPDPSDTLEAYTRISYIRDFINGKGNPTTYKKCEAMINGNLKISKTSPPSDTLLAYTKKHPLREMAKLKVHDFSSVAKVTSEHGSKSNGGDVGYLTGLSEQSIPYEYENAAYKGKQGEVYGPIRTELGYHLVLVTDKRPHVELRISHIMFNFRKSMTHEDSLKLKNKVDSVFGLLSKGANYEEVTKNVSEHRESAKKGGDLGWLAISANYPADFKAAAFAIKSNGQFSEPLQTKYGWHIIKRVDSRELPSFDSLKNDLKTKVQQDSRNNVAKKSMIAKIKKQYQYKELSKPFADFYAVIDSTLPLGLWKAEKAKNLTKPMFSLNDKIYTQQDFASYIEKNQKLVTNASPNKMVDALYKNFPDETAMNLKESLLEEEYPDFKSLMNEYRDGILLFNLTDQKVWTKAIKDTTGAKEYHSKNKDHFMWEDRMDASIYTCKDEKVAEKVRKLIKQEKSDKDIVSELNKDTLVNVEIESKLFLKGDNALLDAQKWRLGVTPNEVVKNKTLLANLRKTVTSIPKTYVESRGLVTSEYQSWLEKEWVSSLKKKYPVSINRNVFDSIK
jgi:peptidyl-prolyl cis-trans isomerase SurA